MTTSPMSKALRQFRHVMLARDEAGLTDGQLLECFIAQRDEAAFEALVRRHGPMVLGVCRRITRHAEDAEDAFQAAFLVLARKATTVRPRELVGNWLYGVACRTALKAWAASARRRAKERQVYDMPEDRIEPESLAHELLPLLDQELERLPEKYRVPVVLCELEGRSRRDVAKQLALPEGTLSSRLATARQLLAGRLSRHGVAVSTAAVTAAISSTATAGMPASLISTTVKAATLVAVGQAATAGLISSQVAVLTEGVLKTMLLTKLKIVTACVLAVSAVAVTANVPSWRGVFAGPAVARETSSSRASIRDANRNEVPVNALPDKVAAVEAAKGDDLPALPPLPRPPDKIAAVKAVPVVAPDEAAKKAREAKERARKIVDEALKRVEEAVKKYEKAQEVADHVREAALDAVERATEAALDAVERAAEAIADKPVVGSGKPETKKMDIADFSSLNVSSAFEIELTKADKFAVSITADDNLLEHIKVDKKDATLRISIVEGKSVQSKSPLRATITMPTLKGLALSGACRATLKGFDSNEDFKVKLSGATTVDGTIKAKNVTIDASGASKVSLKGSGKAAKISGSGASKFLLAEFAFDSNEDLTVKLSGASTFEGNVKAKSAKLEASGGSKVTLKGSAKEAKISGGGSSDFLLAEFALDSADVHLGGSSKAVVNAKSKLNCVVGGSSKLKYLGKPTISKVTSGSSSVTGE